VRSTLRAVPANGGCHLFPLDPATSFSLVSPVSLSCIEEEKNGPFPATRGNVRFGRHHTWDANARWNFGTGFPYTPTAGYYETVTFDETGKVNHLISNGDLGILYGEYNSARLPAYHRLDVAVGKTFQFEGTTVLEVEISIINLYNRKNIFYMDRRTNEQVYQLPFLPSLKVGLEF